ncbi:MAG: T9SS type A sorting domain-containing protein [Saprospiraceae bacterium]|nr:T9SS type A sorting domain-containing protein [Saprospiraceae bacterium]
MVVKTTWTWIWILLMMASTMNGQGIPNIIVEHLEKQNEKWGLSSEDISNLIISDQYTDPKTNLTYYYLQQSVYGIPVDRSITPVIISHDGSLYSAGHGFFKKINNRLKRSTGSFLSHETAILQAAQSMKVELPERLQSAPSRWENISTYSSKNYDEEILIEKVYTMDQQGLFVLSWKITMDDPQSSDSWEVFININSGEKISSYNNTIYCHHAKGKFSGRDPLCTHGPDIFNEMLNAPEAQYLVYPLPLVDPREGSRSLANDGQFPDASPLGWHATDDGGSFSTITRGNNVHAYEDTDANNVSKNNEPDGGDNLSFTFANDLNGNPLLSQNASVTNLFYVNNMAHDLFYLLGFTELSGNFQDNNFGLGGRQDDYVRAEGLDGSDIGNANFSTRPDGLRGRMQMFLFSNLPGILQIEAPNELGDLTFEIGRADFGPEPNQIDVNAEVAFSVTNDNENPTEGCGAIVNDVNNKITLIDRGGCDFSLKVLNAQNAGAVMALVCNIEGVDGGTGEELITMGAGEGASQVNIPSFFLKKSDCDIIKTTIKNGSEVIMSAREREAEGPPFLDSSYDNGVILHEYAHGVSLRLTGGPSNTGCLPDFDDDADGFADRGEQMGEGWSDFFGLIFTTKVGDDGTLPRGIGTYLVNADEEEGGFRVFPFSTDMSINPLTYDDIKTQSVPHGVGTVWAAILWDMYWEMIDLYGFNPDWTDTSSGNYKAAFLVMEGMKLQPCRPGFVDGRNAILQSDAIHNDGLHEKLIWEVFARRGVGMNADQGSSLDNRDGTEDFSIPPLLIEELKIEKEVSKFVEPGENYNVSLDVVNHIPLTQTGITIVDELPEGTVYVDGSGTIEPELISNTLIFDLGEMEYLEEIKIEYQLNSNPDITSTTLYLDDVESSNTEWSTESREGSTRWTRVTNQALSGTSSWYIEETDDEEIDQILVSPSLFVTGINPVLRFWHRYEIVAGANGGFVEISVDGSDWEKVDEHFIIRNEYPGELAFSTFAIPALNGFSGSTDRKWIDTYLDLNDYRSQNIRVRFRFGNEGELVSEGDDPGWFIDEIELLDMNTYSSSACVSSDQDPVERCTDIQTTVINSTSTTSTESETTVEKINVYPNPVRDLLTITSNRPIKSNIILSSSDGMVISQMRLDNEQYIQLDVSHLPSGMYLLNIVNNTSGLVKKIIITD